MLSTKEAAQRLGLKSTGVVRQLILADRLKAEKRGRDWWVDEESVEEYAKSDRKRGPKSKKRDVVLETSVACQRGKSTIPGTDTAPESEN